MKKSAVRATKQLRRNTDKARAVGLLDLPMVVEIESLFVPHGKDKVERQFITAAHNQGNIYTPEELAVRAAELMRDCAASGVNLTIENRPMWPLAMGYYCSRICIRQTRSIVAKILKEFAIKFAHLH